MTFFFYSCFPPHHLLMVGGGDFEITLFHTPAHTPGEVQLVSFQIVQE